MIFEVPINAWLSLDGNVFLLTICLYHTILHDITLQHTLISGRPFLLVLHWHKCHFKKILPMLYFHPWDYFITVSLCLFIPSPIFHCFKLYNWVVFSMFMLLCKNHHKFQNISSTSKGKPISISNQSLFSPILFPGAL